MKYFTNITTLDELKKAYRRLAMQYHPDCGGDEETMKAINAEHDALFEQLKRAHNETADEYHQTTETAEEALNILRRYQGQGAPTPQDFTRGLFYRGVE